MISAGYFKAYARLLLNARTLTIQAARHLPHLEQPEALATEVQAFFRELRPTAD